MWNKNIHKIDKIEPINKTEKVDEDVYLGDQSVIDRLENILNKIKDGYYDDETKEKIYYQNKIFSIDDETEKQNLKQDLKYYITGWFIHNFFNENFNENTDEKLETQD